MRGGIAGKKATTNTINEGKKLKKIDVINEKHYEVSFLLLSRKNPDWNKMAGKDKV